MSQTKTIPIAALKEYIASNPDIETVSLQELYQKQSAVDFEGLFGVFDSMSESDRLKYILYLSNLQHYTLNGTYIVEYDYLDEDWIVHKFEPTLVAHKIDLCNPKHLQKVLKGLFMRTCLAYKRGVKVV